MDIVQDFSVFKRSFESQLPTTHQAMTRYSLLANQLANVSCQTIFMGDLPSSHMSC